MRTSKLNLHVAFDKSGATPTEPVVASISDRRVPPIEHARENLDISEGEQDLNLRGLADRIKNLEAQVLYRQILLEDVIHRTSNTLQTAISALDAEIDVASDTWTVNDLRGLRKQLRALSGTHCQLYGPIDRVDSSLKTRLLEICSSIFQSFGKRSAPVVLAIQLADVPLQRHQEIGLCVMLQELVTNALKHGFPCDSQGTVWVEFGADEAAVCHLVVSDDGAGRPTLPRNATGLSLVNDYASLLEGQFEISWGPRKVAKVSFPLAAG